MEAAFEDFVLLAAHDLFIGTLLSLEGDVLLEGSAELLQDLRVYW